MTQPQFDLLIKGFPGVSPSNGGMGWSSVGLVRTGDRVVLLDTGPFGVRELLRSRLAAHGLTPGDVTDVILTHSHHDHCVNWPMFTEARIYIADVELQWALTQPQGVTPVADLYMTELAKRTGTVRLGDADEVLPGITTELAPGHTPGSLLIRVDGGTGSTVFVGDAVKNRAELLSRRGVMAWDDAVSTASITQISEAWRDDARCTLVPGHDLPLVTDASGCCHRVGEWESSVQARFGDNLDDLTTIRLIP